MPSSHPSVTDDASSVSNVSRPSSPVTSAQIAMDSATKKASKYAKVSYHLTNDPNAIKRYREMAEKTNSTTTQLMFAKYLLETAYAFYAANDPERPPEIVGSMWGVSTTSKKSQRPEPTLIVEDVDHNSSGHQSMVSSNKAPTVVTHITRKQYVSLSERVIPDKRAEQAIDPARLAKRKALEEEGIRWIKKLVKLHVGEACYMMAHWMDKELYGFKKNASKSLQLHTVAAKSGIPESLFAIALHFDKLGEQPEKVLKCYQQSAEQGYVNAIYVNY